MYNNIHIRIIICDNVAYEGFASTPLRKDTGVFEIFGRFIGLKCHNYAIYLCLCIYIYIVFLFITVHG